MINIVAQKRGAKQNICLSVSLNNALQVKVKTGAVKEKCHEPLYISLAGTGGELCVTPLDLIFCRDEKSLELSS